MKSDPLADAARAEVNKLVREAGVGVFDGDITVVVNKPWRWISQEWFRSDTRHARETFLGMVLGSLGMILLVVMIVAIVTVVVIGNAIRPANHDQTQRYTTIVQACEHSTDVSDCLSKNAVTP